jgi:hypothetical protein
LGAAAAVRILQVARIGVVHLLLAGLLLAFLVSFWRGVTAFGLMAAGVDARESFYFLAGATYFATCDLESLDMRRLTDQWLLAASALSVLAVFRWIAWAMDLGITAQWEGVGYFDIRVLNSSHALFLGIAFFISLQLTLDGQGKPWQRRLAYVLAPTILMLQHRTVWVVAAVGVVWLLAASRQRRARLMVHLGVMLLMGAVFFLVLFGSDLDQVSSSLETSATNPDTFRWRVEGWKQLLTSHRDLEPLDRLIGQPFGAGYLRFIAGRAVIETPHNYYVQALLRLGIVGLLLLIATYLTGLRGIARSSNRRSHHPILGPRIWELCLLAQLLFFVTYAPSYEQGIVLGVTLGWAGVSRARRHEVGHSREREPWQPAASPS